MYSGVESSPTILAGIEQHSYQIFYMFTEVPLTQNNHHPVHILFFTYGMFFSNPTGPFVPTEDALFVQQLRTEKQNGNVVSAQNGCARTTLSRKFK
jgi:hypothetical protein